MKNNPPAPPSSNMPTFYQITNAVKTGGPLTTPTVKFKIVNGFEREDGSGHCFNIKGIDTNGRAAVAFVRTID